MTTLQECYASHVAGYAHSGATPPQPTRFPIPASELQQYMDWFSRAALAGGATMLDNGDRVIDEDWELACEYQKAAEILLDAGLHRAVRNWLEAAVWRQIVEDDAADEADHQATQNSVRPGL